MDKRGGLKEVGIDLFSWYLRGKMSCPLLDSKLCSRKDPPFITL
jgi:hypothetical protein